jgi:hypothetical protein
MVLAGDCGAIVHNSEVKDLAATMIVLVVTVNLETTVPPLAVVVSLIFRGALQVLEVVLRPRTIATFFLSLLFTILSFSVVPVLLIAAEIDVIGGEGRPIARERSLRVLGLVGEAL